MPLTSRKMFHGFRVEGFGASTCEIWFAQRFYRWTFPKCKIAETNCMPDGSNAHGSTRFCQLPQLCVNRKESIQSMYQSHDHLGVHGDVARCSDSANGQDDLQVPYHTTGERRKPTAPRRDPPGDMIVFGNPVWDSDRCEFLTDKPFRAFGTLLLCSSIRQSDPRPRVAQPSGSLEHVLPLKPQGRLRKTRAKLAFCPCSTLFS